MSAGGLFVHRGHSGGRAFAVHRAKTGARTMRLFGDALAETGRVSSAAAMAGVSNARGYQLFAQMRRELGWQAQ